MRNGAYNSKIDVLLLLFNEHDKYIKYTQNLFHVLGPEHEKEKTELIPGVPFL